MAKKPNNNNFPEEMFMFKAQDNPTDFNLRQKAEMGKINKEENKKTHVSVLLRREDFEYVRDVCYNRRISKNEFFRELLNEYRRTH